MELEQNWKKIIDIRNEVNSSIENMRAEKIIGSSLEANIEIELNKAWWRNQNWKIVVSPGLFTHERLSDRGY